ncbi:MAG TPA: hypothetical protein VFN67_10040, partial [Polyangiales bacterium]|nr:hypothetical protein [Polyangiales bacterium]
AISYLDADQKPLEWAPNWQLKRATHANWLPLSPRPQHYIQGFVLPLGATQPRLQLRLDKTDKALGPASRWDLTELSIVEVSAAASCKRLSADRQLGGDFEGTPKDGLPAFWVQWSRGENNHVELIDTQTPCQHVLRIQPGTQALVATTYLVPVTPGSAYQISVRARGRGRVALDAHSLSRDRPTPQRVGNSTFDAHGINTFEVASDTWTQLSQVWFAEAPNVASTQVMIAVDALTAVEIDAVELHECVSSP